MSEVLATVLLTAMTVVVLGGFSLLVFTSLDSTTQPPTGSFSLEAQPGDGFALLRFVSGTAFPLDAADVALMVNGSRADGSRTLVSPQVPDTFSPGGTLRLDLASGTLPQDARLMALVVERESGKSIGSTVATLLSASTLPPFVATVPAVSTIDLSPSVLVVDGDSLANLSVQVTSGWGLGLVRSVTVNLSTVGGPADFALLDDGNPPDLVAADGIYTGQVSAVSHSFVRVPAQEQVTVPVTVVDALGKVATADATLTLEPSPLSKVGTGAKYRPIPESPALRWLNLTNFTFRDTSVLDNDQIQVRVTDLGDTDAWNALVTFDNPTDCGGSAGVTSITLSRDGVAGSVTYTPSPGPCFSLGTLAQINLADPTASLNGAGATGSWSTSGAVASYLYSAANIGTDNEATIAFFGDSVSPSPAALGLAQADLTWARLTTNHAPVASFSTTSSLTSLTVNVDASASTDSDGDALTYSWDWGDASSSSSGSSPTTSHAYSTGGTYTITLTATDPYGLTATTTRSVSVNRAPTASFTTSASNLQLDVDSSASSDPDGQALTRAWAWGDGNTDSGGVTRSHTYAASGTYTVVLTVTDTFGVSSTSSATVSVSNANTPPTSSLSANVTTGNVPLDVRFTLGGSDPDGSIASWTLTHGDGTSTSGTTLPATRDKQYTVAGGNYPANLTVTDNNGATHTTQVVITTNAPPVPTLSANRTSGAAPMDVLFTLGGSDPDGSVASWSMSFGDGTSSSGTTLPILQGKKYNLSSTYQANLTVTDNGGATATATVTIVANALPTATLSANVTTGAAPLDVRFSLGGSDPGGSIASWTLSYGDGTSATGTSLPTTRDKQYPLASTYAANLTVTDNDGATHTASVTIVANARPTASFVVTGTSLLTVNVDGTGSSDPGGSVASWAWEWGDGTTSTTASGTTSHVYATGGSYQVNLTVTDNLGATSAAVQQVATPNRAPTLTSLTVTSLNELNATLSTVASDPDGQTITYVYAWGDATNVSDRGTTSTAIHTWAQPGNYTVTVFVNDTLGGSASATTLVQATSNLYALLNVTDVGTPAGTITNGERVQAADGSSATLTEATGAGSSYTQPAACDRTFDGCSFPSTWALVSGTFQNPAIFTGGSTLSGGTSANSLVLHNAGGADALQFATYKATWTQSANSAADVGTFTMGYKFETTTAGQKVNMILVAPSGAKVNLSTSSTVSTSWTAFPTGSTIPATMLQEGGTFTLFANVTVQKNREVYIDDVNVTWPDAPAYRAQKQWTFTGLPTGSGLSHHLEVVARQATNAEGLQIQVEGPSGTWTTRATVSTTSLATYSYKLTASDLQGGMARVRLVDPAGADVAQSTWEIDAIRIVVRGGP